MTAAADRAPDRSIMKVAATALAGSSIEWYDFFIYGTAAALVFPKLFFPDTLPPLIAQLAAFSTFAVGFIARPIGGAAFGHFGDRVGRKKALVIALVLMGMATTLIGCLPSYAQVGVLAPLALIVLRFIQGFAVGGQWGGAVLLITESAPKERRGYFGSFAQIGVPIGVVFANLVFLLINAELSPESFQAWGWRVPFLISVLLVACAIYVQLKLEDTPAFRQLQSKQAKTAKPERSPVLEVILKHPRQVLLAGGAYVASNGTFYIFITYVIAYGVNIGIPRSQILTGVLIASIAMIPAVIGFAALSDRIGRRALFMTGAALTGAWSFAFFPLVDTGSFTMVLLAITGGLVSLSAMYGPQAAFFSEIFATKVRYSGASIGYQLGAIFGGGFAPIIATALFARYGVTLPISLYMALLCTISFVSAWLLSETYKNDMHEPQA